MRNRPDNQGLRPIFTTSWDDGHPLDMQMAELLSKYGFRGTFYIPVKYDGRPLLRPPEIRSLIDMGMEVGSHTYSHPVLTDLPPGQIFEELLHSKMFLEDLLGIKVKSVCYPKGRFNRTVKAKAADAGYSLGRTTVGFRTRMKTDPFCMPVSIQFYPHKKSTLIRHAIKDGNFAGLANWISRWNLATDLDKLSQEMSEYVFSNGGVFHLWGHSWEIEDTGLWSALEDLLRRISDQKAASFLTNSQVLGL